jgi:putative PEP-CTERM system TPR-repeat lipoprotein
MAKFKLLDALGNSRNRLVNFTGLRNSAFGALVAVLCVSVSLEARAADSKASRYYEDALVRYEKKDIPGTIIQLKNALQVDKTLLPVQVLLGKALMQNGEVAAAEVAMLEALRLGVNRAEIVIPLGQAYLAQGKHLPMLEQSTFNPAGLPPATQLQLQLLRAAAFADLGRSREAMKAIDEARSIDSRSADVWLAEVSVRIRARQFKEAMEAADKAILLTPDSPEGWYQKGSIQHVRGDMTAALQSYDRVLQSQPENIEARVSRAGIYLDLGRYADAGKDVSELQRLSPQDPRGAYMKALLAEREGDTATANAALKDVTDLLDPVPIDFIRYRPQLLMLNGLAHYSLNQREKAKQYLEAFQKVQPNSPATKLLARIYMAEGNPATAVILLEAYLRAQPGDGQALTQLASAQMSLGRPAKATALMQDALKTQDNPAFRTVLGLSLVGAGQSASGLTELEMAYKNDPRQTQAATALVQMYLRSGQSRKAIPVAEALVKMQPTNPGYHNMLGMAQGQSGNAAAARASFEKAIQLNGSLVSPKLNLARLETATKAYDAASVRLNDILKADPRNSEAAFELAVIADRKGQQAEAQRWIEKARDIAGPQDLRWGLALVDFHLRYGHPAAALEAAKTVYAKAPEDLATLMAYSRAQLANGDAAAAKTTLGAATRFADYNAPRQVEIANLQLAASNPAGAAYSLEKALSSSPDYLPAQALMTAVDLRTGNVAKAEKRALGIVTLNPKRAVGFSLQGDIAMAKGQSAAAVEAYRRAHRAEPSSSTLLQLFRALSSSEGEKTGQQVVEGWLKINTQDNTARKALADSYARAGNFSEARLTYDAALKINPDDAEVLNNLANVQLRLKDPGAVKTAERALGKAPGNPLLIDTLGWALLQNGQPDRAVQVLRDARLREPGNPEIRYHLAVALAQTGRKVEAKEELEVALKGGRSFESAGEAEKLLRLVR